MMLINFLGRHSAWLDVLICALKLWLRYTIETERSLFLESVLNRFLTGRITHE